jgi:tRNA(Met) cytidine acetyltransferase
MTHPTNTRRLWVLHGCRAQLFNQISSFIYQHSGDWLTVTTQTDLPAAFKYKTHPNQTKSLLGQEFKHAVFDATEGFNLDAFAILAGTLIKGSMLILLLPSDFTNWVDQDSLRWNESTQPIQVNNFIRHLQQTLSDFATDQLPTFTPMNFMSADDKQNDLTQQQIVLAQLLQSDSPLNILIAKRGRGKSALAGLFTHHHQCWVTAPNKSALSTFFQFAKKATPFYAPDQLIEMTEHTFPDWLIIDEAAMIPLPMLEKLLQLALSKQTQIVLITTVEGYEGTGQGFLLKLLDNQTHQRYYLNAPIRWQNNDELEQFCDKLLLNGVLAHDTKSQTDLQAINYRIANDPIINYSITERQDVATLKSVYYLLKTAHYQTTLVDLRRLFDAENLTVWQAQNSQQLVAAAITVDEGHLSDELIDAIWKGTRRPKGNLVAQSLVAHAGDKLAAKLKSVRINRIAVIELYRRQQIAKQLVQHIYQQAVITNKDFVSVSFAYSTANYQFWCACGFQLVHIASHKQANSGNYSMMMIKPITQQGHQLTQRLAQNLMRNGYWLHAIIDLPIDQLLTIDDQQGLTLQDHQNLQGFCYYHRPFEASYPSLARLLMDNAQNSQTPMPLLTALLQNKNSESALIKQYQLTGRNELMQAIKREVGMWLKNHPTEQIKNS